MQLYTELFDTYLKAVGNVFHTESIRDVCLISLEHFIDNINGIR